MYIYDSIYYDNYDTMTTYLMYTFHSLTLTQMKKNPIEQKCIIASY